MGSARFPIAVFVMLACTASAAQTRLDGSLREPYRIECAQTPAQCRTDLATYLGWRVFHAQCAACHAADALGSSFAPDLTRRLRGMDAREFFTALDKGYMGPDDSSPPRGQNPDVARYYQELWAYLSARRNGDLPPGPLERLPDAEPRVPD